MRHTISVLVENEFGVLARIAGLFSSRGFNIESLSVAPSLDPEISRMTIVTAGSTAVIEQIVKHLNKLINIIKVTDVTGEDLIHKVLALVKINLSRKNKEKILSLIKNFDAKILHTDTTCSVIQICENAENLKKLLSLFKPYGIMEYTSTGSIVLPKVKR
jgi:acetolactate synthase-1/3 small subunit